MKHQALSAWVFLLPGSFLAASQPAEVRQVVIRAPEAQVLKLVANTRISDTEFVGQLRQSVKSGTAHVISDVSGASDGSGAFTVSAGQHAWLPSEMGQDTDRLFMPPTNFKEHFIGTSLVGRPVAEDRHVREWETRYSPRPPLIVKWPTSWLNIREPDGVVRDRAIHGWLDWRDLFEESVSGRLWFSGSGPALIAILPPGDQVWPREDKERFLDVFFAELAQPGLHENAGASESSSSVSRTVLYGIAVNSGEALLLASTRKPGEDATLLQALLAKVEQKRARMMFCIASANDPGDRRELISARQHFYPTEMPSIPSGWGSEWVGTHWTRDGGFALQQDLAPPARTEWKLALDVPEAIMWEPRFRRLNLQTHSPKTGTHLLSLLHVPEVMHGDGIAADETIFIFSQSSRIDPPPRNAAFPPDPFTDRWPQPIREHLNLEILVFEVPEAEASLWLPAVENQWTKPDSKRLKNLLKRVEAGTASLAAHIAMQVEAGQRGTARIAEDYMTAIEFDPPEFPNSPRMRPTALEALMVGTQWSVEATASSPESSIISIEHELRHSTVRPMEPSLAETLVIAAKGTEDYPGAVHHVETWTGMFTLKPGLARCLGSQKPPGLNRKVHHVAFVRAAAPL